MSMTGATRETQTETQIGVPILQASYRPRLVHRSFLLHARVELFRVIGGKIFTSITTKHIVPLVSFLFWAEIGLEKPLGDMGEGKC